MDTKGRLAKLEARIAALEKRSPEPASPSPADPSTGSGTVEYHGDVRLQGKVQWRIRYDVDAVLELSAPLTVDVLFAIGHPTRLAVVRRLLNGPATVAELQDELRVESSGKLYHHLRALVAARVVTSIDQAYSVPATAVVPVLTLLLAAGDVAGLLHEPAGAAPS